MLLEICFCWYTLYIYWDKQYGFGQDSQVINWKELWAMPIVKTMLKLNEITPIVFIKFAPRGWQCIHVLWQAAHLLPATKFYTQDIWTRILNQRFLLNIYKGAHGRGSENPCLNIVSAIRESNKFPNNFKLITKWLKCIAYNFSKQAGGGGEHADL